MTTIPCHPPTEPSAPAFDETHLSLAEIARKFFGLPSDLPLTTNHKTTIRPAVVLPLEFTRTLRARAQLKGTPCSR